MTDRDESVLTVTEPFLPPLAEFTPLLEEIWQSRMLTNGGPMHQRLETALADYLHVPYVALFNNGMNALLAALQVSGLTGEVITTPYSFAATAHSIFWNRLTPVFVDVDPATFNLDPSCIEAAITDKTAAIMPVHCYGYPCDVAAIRGIAAKHRLKVIYDAAHAFGVRLDGESLVGHGDLAVLSFHATKVFNTFEGGAIVCHDADVKRDIDRLKNFGIFDEATIGAAGLNGKLSEVPSAFGLLQLRYIDEAIARRRQIDQIYRQRLASVEGIDMPAVPANVRHNAAYFPILVRDNFPVSRDELWQRMHAGKILARRYFHPLLSELPMYSAHPSASPGNLKHAHVLTQQVLCIPIHPGLTEASIDRVVRVIVDCR